MVLVRKNAKSRLGWRVESVFKIGLHKKDLALLKQIQAYFGGIGSIAKQGKEDMYAYRVSSLRQMLSHILPHFDLYPLITQKRGDYLLWREVVLIMKSGEHLSMKGLQAIVNIRASINLGLSEDLKTAFPDTVPVLRPIMDKNDRIIPHPEWVAGFTTGEGCFLIKILNLSKSRTGYQIVTVFKLTQHSRDEQLIRSLIDYLECGKVYVHGTVVDYIVTKLTDITDKIVPLFRESSIKGVKFLDFLAFVSVVELMNNKNHLTVKGVNQIKEIKASMNANRTEYFDIEDN